MIESYNLIYRCDHIGKWKDWDSHNISFLIELAGSAWCCIELQPSLQMGLHGKVERLTIIISAVWLNATVGLSFIFCSSKFTKVSIYHALQCGLPEYHQNNMALLYETLV